jgi:hypothetical protein
MLRDATHEPPITRTVMVHLDSEGVLLLDEQVVAGLREGDALAVPDPLPTCESCWSGPAVAIALAPRQPATFEGAACAADRRQAGVRLVPLLHRPNGPYDLP